MTTLTISQIERDIDARGLWMSITSQVELIPKGEKRTWIAYVYSVRTMLASARAESANEAKRKAYAKLVEHEAT